MRFLYRLTWFYHNNSIMSDFELARKLRDCLVHLTDGKVTERKVV